MKKATVILALVGLFNATAYAQQSGYWGGLLYGLAQGIAQQQQAKFEREQKQQREQEIQAEIQTFLDQIESQKREREAALALQRQFQTVLREISETLSQLNPEMREQAREGLWRELESGRLDKNVVLRAVMALTLLEYPTQALQVYREKMGKAAKLVVVGMEANEFSIADPNDAGMLDVVGFDANTPSVIADFIRN